MDQLKNHPLFLKHNIDSAMNSLWGFYKNNFLVLFTASFLMSLVIQYASSLLNMNELQGITEPSELIEKIRNLIMPLMLVSVINLFFSAIIHYYVIYNPVDADKNIFVSILDTLRYFIPYLIILVLLSFAGSIAIVAGIFIFIVGAFFAFLYIMTLYLFILPVMMIEGPHIGNTIGRVLRLVHRSLWPNLGWVGVFLILLIVISVILSGLALIPFSGNFMKAVFSPDQAQNMADFAKSPVYIILSALANALTFPLIPIFALILYFNGKASEEQVQTISKPEEVKVRVEDLYAKPYQEDNPEEPEK